jgi:hypothetical protein
MTYPGQDGPDTPPVKRRPQAQQQATLTPGFLILQDHVSHEILRPGTGTPTGTEAAIRTSAVRRRPPRFFGAFKAISVSRSPCSFRVAMRTSKSLASGTP